MEQRTRKLMVHKTLHPRGDIDRLKGSRKGGRGLVSIEDSVAASIQGLEDYTKKEQRRANNSTDNIRTN